MEDKNTYIENLVTNDSFVAWVKSDFTINNDEWSTFKENNPNNLNDIELSISLVKLLQDNNEIPINTSELWNKIDASTKKAPQAKNKFRILYISLTSIAAAIIIGLIYLQGVANVIETKPKSQQNVLLPDQSFVVLGADSELHYNKSDYSNKRELNLKGLAFFEVIKGNEFTVATDLGNIKVLGTSFSVNARNKTLEVACKTGKVQVTSPNNKNSIILTPGYSVKFTEDGNSILDSLHNESILGWIQGNFYFDNVPFGDVVKEIEAQFGINVQYDKSLNSLKWNGVFANSDLEKALYDITWTLHLEYTKDQNKVIIYRK